MKTIVVNEGNRNIINEAFRVLRSNIDFMASKDSNQHVFVLTSFNPGSGKSFLAMNIAISFAIKRRKSWSLTETSGTEPSLLMSILRTRD